MSIRFNSRGSLNNLRFGRVTACIRPSVGVALMVIIGTGLTTRAYSGTGYAKPQLVIEETRFDFGEVFKGEALTHTFRFRNNGDAELQLNDAEVLPQKKKPAPGAASILHIVKPGGHDPALVTPAGFRTGTLSLARGGPADPAAAPS